MHLTALLRRVCLCTLGGLLIALHTTAWAGILGYPVPRLKPLQARIELAGDSFQETLDRFDNAKDSTSRGLLSLVFAPTEWSEIYGRFGMAEVNVKRLSFNGDFGFAYGGGARIRLFRLAWGGGGVFGQYLRFQSDDNNNPQRDATSDEIDVGLGLGSRRFGAFQFYGGGAYHETTLNIRDNRLNSRTRLRSNIPFRGFVGVHIYPLTDFPDGEFVVNVEARFIGEIPSSLLEYSIPSNARKVGARS